MAVQAATAQKKWNQISIFENHFREGMQLK